MIFGAFPLAEALGAVVAHSHRLAGRVLKKGAVLDEAALAALREAGRETVIAARFEPGDVAEPGRSMPQKRSGDRPRAFSARIHVSWRRTASDSPKP